MTYCPMCGSGDHYSCKRRPTKKRCKACGADYSITAGTNAAHSKLSEEKRKLLAQTIDATPTLSAQKIADIAGVSLKTAWLWKVRTLKGKDAVRGYFQGARHAGGLTISVWKVRHEEPWHERRKAKFTSMWQRGCPISCMAAMFRVEPGSISSRARRQGLISRVRA